MSGQQGQQQQIEPGASKRQAEQYGIPEGFKIGSAFPFSGLNLSDSRTGIKDQEFSWLENYVRIGAGRMRATYDNGTAIYTAPTNLYVVSFFWFNIGSTFYCAIFLNDGTAVQIDLEGNQTTISSTAGTFYESGGILPACCPWGTQYLLIASNITANSYWVWDGKLLYASGTISPVIDITSGGSGYTSAPTVTAFGGEGSGATFTATIENGSVVNVQPTAVGSGYGPGDTVQLLFTGGGTDNGAELTANLTTGTVALLILTNGGSGYTSVPTVALTGGGGTGATAIAQLVGGGIAAISVGAGGTSYTTAPNVLISGGGGTGATATATVSSGAVTFITVTNAGSGYTTLPTITLTGGGGSGATATATLYGSKISALVVTAPGSGYTGSPAVGISGGGGSGGAGVSVLSAGMVASVTVVNGGTNFPETPTLTFVGGGGTDAAATAVLTAGVITSVNVTNGGSGYTTAPAVEVETGVNNAASATVEMMPIGISGSAIETFQSRAWITYPYQAGTLPAGGDINVSAPGSFTDFATSDGGVLFTNSDRFLRQEYVTLRQSNGYLYTLGDSSASVISNVQTSGSPITTTFNNLNVDPQIGTSWRDSCADYSRTILFGNPYGVFGIYGGAITKVSKKLDPLFTAAVFPPVSGALTPSAAVAQIYAARIYLMLMTITDPFTGNPRNVMIGWDETDWTIYSQSAALTYIGTSERNSDLIAYGTDGKSIYQLFETPSSTLQKTLQTKYYGSQTAFLIHGSYAIYVTAEIKIAGQTSLTFTTTVDSIGVGNPVSLPVWMADEVPVTGGSYPMTNNPVSFTIPTLNQPVAFGTATDPVVAGVGLGLTMVTTAPDYELVNLQFGYMDVQAIA